MTFLFILVYLRKQIKLKSRFEIKEKVFCFDRPLYLISINICFYVSIFFTSQFVPIYISLFLFACQFISTLVSSNLIQFLHVQLIVYPLVTSTSSFQSLGINIISLYDISSDNLSVSIMVYNYVYI